MAAMVREHGGALSEIAGSVMTSYPQVLVNVKVGSKPPETPDWHRSLSVPRTTGSRLPWSSCNGCTALPTTSAANDGTDHPAKPNTNPATAPLIRRTDGTVELLEPRYAAVWSSGDALLDSTTVELRPGDAVLLPTRGLTETTNPAGSPFTAERLATTLREATDTKPTQLIRHVVRAVHDYADDAEPKDDLTLLAIRRTV